MPDQASEAGSPTTIRRKLKMAGFSPIPTRGKIPPMEGWQQKLDVSMDEIASWARDYPDATNTSLLTRLTPAIDVDITDPDAANAVERVIRARFGTRDERILVRYGKEPKRAILTRTDTPFKKMARTFTTPSGIAHKIEILGDGQQIVVDGVHPDTGQRYRWQDLTPAEIGREALPSITQTEAAMLLAEIGLTLTRDFRWQLRRGTDSDTRKPEEDIPDWNQLLTHLYHGHELHDTIRDLAARMIVAGTSEGAAVNLLRGLVEAAPIAHDRRWQERYDDIPRAVHSAVEMYERSARERERTAFGLIDFSGWDSVPVPEQEWAVDNRIPLGEVALFSGEGATGKSTIILHLCACHALGRPWLGAEVRQGPALLVDAEDKEKLLHRRLASILRHQGATFASVVGKLHMMSLSGHDAVMAILGRRSGKIEATPLYKEIREMAGDLRPVMIGIASAADAFAGSEIDRSQVRQFISMLTHLAGVSGGSVVLISHPSLTGKTNDSGISGSTAWHNSVRARMYLKMIERESNKRELQFRKNNYGPLSGSIVLQWDSGMFLPDTAENVEISVREERVEIIYLDVFRLLVGQGHVLRPNRSNSYAAGLIGDHPRSAGTTQNELAAAQQRLLDRGILQIVNDGRPSRPTLRLVEVAQSDASDA